MKGVILAAGRGSRLGDATDVLPKPLMPVAGRTCIDFAVEALLAVVDEVIVVTGYAALETAKESVLAGAYDYLPKPVSRLRTLWDVVVPSALPELLNGIRTALALSFILLVSSELIVARQGLGYLIGYLGDGGNYAGMFAVTVIVAALGFAADRGYMALTRSEEHTSELQSH